MAIKLEELNFARLCDWLSIAGHKKDDDVVFAFIATWVSFNYYYSTFASSNNEDFKEWAKSQRSGNYGDKSQWVYLINHPDFLNFFDSFKINFPGLFQTQIKLPVINMLDATKWVPSNISGEVALNTLSAEQIFEIVYQIRNNLFHGDKNPFKNKRDRDLTIISLNFLYPLMIELLKFTFGYEMDAFDLSPAEEEIYRLLYPNSRM